MPMRNHLAFWPFLRRLPINCNVPSCGSRPNSRQPTSRFGKANVTITTEFVSLIFSADFRQHVVSTLLVGLFECHDRSRFDVTALSFGPSDNSELRQRLEASVANFIDVTNLSDDQIAKLVRSLEIDILVDLMGFTSDSRPGILARKPAPVQVNYLGYLGTMGAPFIDYIIADRTVIPQDQHEFYSEKIAYLPNSFQPTDRGRGGRDETVFTRGGGSATGWLRLLLLQRQLQDRTGCIRRLDADPEAGGR